MSLDPGTVVVCAGRLAIGGGTVAQRRVCARTTEVGDGVGRGGEVSSNGTPRRMLMRSLTRRAAEVVGEWCSI